LAPTPTGESIPIQGQNIPNRTLERSPMSGIMGEEQQNLVSGPGVESQALPNMPRPPAPFESAPVTPQELIT